LISAHHFHASFYLFPGKRKPAFVRLGLTTET
jgi:hypothetical protein